MKMFEKHSQNKSANEPSAPSATRATSSTKPSLPKHTTTHNSRLNGSPIASALAQQVASRAKTLKGASSEDGTKKSEASEPSPGSVKAKSSKLAQFLSERSPEPRSGTSLPGKSAAPASDSESATKGSSLVSTPSSESAAMEKNSRVANASSSAGAAADNRSGVKLTGIQARIASLRSHSGGSPLLPGKNTTEETKSAASSPSRANSLPIGTNNSNSNDSGDGKKLTGIQARIARLKASSASSPSTSPGLNSGGSKGPSRKKSGGKIGALQGKLNLSAVMAGGGMRPGKGTPVSGSGSISRKSSPPILNTLNSTSMRTPGQEKEKSKTTDDISTPGALTHAALDRAVVPSSGSTGKSRSRRGRRRPTSARIPRSSLFAQMKSATPI